MAYVYDSHLEAFEHYHKAIEEEAKTSILGGPALPALGHAVSGAAGSAISNLISYPLSLVITRLQVQRRLSKAGGNGKLDDEYTSILDAARKIYEQEGGIDAFYAGVGQDTGKALLDAFLFFLSYNFIKQGRLNNHAGAKRLPMAEELGVGMVAGAISRFFTIPVQNIVTRKQTAAMMAARSDSVEAKKQMSNLTTRQIARQIREEKGILGFWSGYSATLILTLNPALTFLFHETLLRMLVKRENRSNPGSRVTFIVAALSKAAASTITYPVGLAKARVQMSSKAVTPPDDTETITEKTSLSEASKTAATKAKQRTIIDVLINIVREEGVSALYSGLEGEVLKGFLTHGLTMLIKEKIHKLVIQAYYFILKLMKKYPGPEEMSQAAVKSVSDAASNVGEKAQKAASSITGAASNVGEKAKEAVNSVTGAASNVGEKAQETANGITGGVQQKLDSTFDTLHDLYKHGRENEMDIWDEYLLGDDDD
ncbi:mitochondrial carrier [Microthyrium microscopicum]|uniref:Mitochondrial carrier n=1 Tax=Microthyrium microscopicum TaxID=703497 RepID=A0A6A6TVL5_9PEZI|nr:mitochondrial carrier [Microthyrium microscopicum]